MSSARGHTDGGDQGQARRVSPRDLVPGHLCVAAFRIPSFSEMFIGVLTDPGPATRVLVSMSHAQLTLLGPLNPRDLPSRTTFSQPSTYLSDKPACGQPISHSYRLPCSGTETGFCPPPPAPEPHSWSPSSALLGLCCLPSNVTAQSSVAGLRSALPCFWEFRVARWEAGC